MVAWSNWLCIEQKSFYWISKTIGIKRHDFLPIHNAIENVFVPSKILVSIQLPDNLLQWQSTSMAIKPTAVSIHLFFCDCLLVLLTNTKPKFSRNALYRRYRSNLERSFSPQNPWHDLNHFITFKTFSSKTDK